MTVKIKGQTIELDLLGYRSELLYENRNGKSLDLSKITVKLISELSYCVVLANIEKKKLLDSLSFEEFLTAIEDENDEGWLTNFFIYYLKTQIERNENLLKNLEELTAEKKKLTQHQ